MYVQDKKPSSCFEAAALADQYCKDRWINLDNPKWLKVNRADKKDFSTQDRPWEPEQEKDNRGNQEVKKEDKLIEEGSLKVYTHKDFQGQGNIRCFACGQIGHIPRMCPARVNVVYNPAKG